MFDVKLNYDSKFYISGQEIPAIESINIGYNQQAQIVNPLGYSKGITIASAETQNSISISRYLTYQDPLLSYMGNTPIRGSIHYNSSSYGFASGYLTEYMINCAVGSVPKVTTNLKVFDKLIRGYSAAGSVATPTMKTPTQGNIFITCDNVSSNRVVGFDYSVKMNRKPIYTIGSNSPYSVELLPPLEYSASVQIEIDDAFMENSENFLTAKENKSIFLRIDYNDGSNLINLNIPKATLIGEQLTASADGVMKLTLNYNGHS